MQIYKLLLHPEFRKPAENNLTQYCTFLLFFCLRPFQISVTYKWYFLSASRQSSICSTGQEAMPTAWFLFCLAPDVYSSYAWRLVLLASWRLIPHLPPPFSAASQRARENIW
jgi:hypothetical protein